MKKVKKKASHAPSNNPLAHAVKRIIQIAMLCILLTSCQSSCKPNPKAEPTTRQLVLVMQDCTVSCKNIDYSNEDVVKNMYYKVALTGGGVIKHINILDEQTANQNVYSMEVSKLDTISLDGVTNVYNRKKFCDQNINRKARFDKEAKEKVAKYITATSLPRTYEYTYLQAALELSRLSLQQSTYKGFNKVLIICSDMKNSVRGRKHNIPLTPINLPDTKVLIVRPALFEVNETELKVIFPQSDVSIYTDVNDAISTINNINN